MAQHGYSTCICAGRLVMIMRMLCKKCFADCKSQKLPLSYTASKSELRNTRLKPAGIKASSCTNPPACSLPGAQSNSSLRSRSINAGPALQENHIEHQRMETIRNPRLLSASLLQCTHIEDLRASCPWERQSCPYWQPFRVAELKT